MGRTEGIIFFLKMQRSLQMPPILKNCWGLYRFLNVRGRPKLICKNLRKYYHSSMYSKSLVRHKIRHKMYFLCQTTCCSKATGCWAFPHVQYMYGNYVLWGLPFALRFLHSFSYNSAEFISENYS